MNNEKVTILGVPVARLTTDEILDRVQQIIISGQKAQLVTANAEIIYRASKDPAFAALLREAELVTADGSGVVWASRLLGAPVPERVTGVGLTERLLALAAENNWGVYFLGARPAVVEKAVLNALTTYKGLQIKGYRDGYFIMQENEEVMSNIDSVRPHILLVALGAPKQEYFIREILARYDIPLAIGVGGTFDVLAGTARRAPAWMQRKGLEWLYRLYQEPSRLGRMMALPKFILAVFRQKCHANPVDKMQKML